MSSLPEINQLPFANAEPSPVPQRLPNIGNVKTLGPYRKVGETIFQANRIQFPTLSGNATYPAGGWYNGTTGGLNDWYFQSPIFFNRPHDFRVFQGAAYQQNYKSLSGVEAGSKIWTYMDIGTGGDVQPRVVKLYGNGTDFSNIMSEETTINQDLKRWNTQYYTPAVTNFTTNNGSIDGITYPKTNFWSKYGQVAFFDTVTADTAEVGCWVRCPKDDLFRLYNFGGFSVTFELTTGGTTALTQDLISHVAVFSRTDNTIVSAGAFTESMLTETNGVSYYHNATLSQRRVTGNYQQAFPAKKTNKYHYFNAEDFGEFTKISFEIPATGITTGTDLGIFDLFFAESTTYLDAHDGVKTGSIEFYNPYINFKTDGALV